MSTNENTYPSWIKYFLGITAWLGLIRSFVTLLTNLTLYGAQVAIPDFIGSILLFIGVMLIISRKFWGYIFYCIIIISQYPLSYYMYGSVNDIVYPAIFVRLIVMSTLVFVPFKSGNSLFNAMKPIFNPLKIFSSKKWSSKAQSPEALASDNALLNNNIASQQEIMKTPTDVLLPETNEIKDRIETDTESIKEDKSEPKEPHRFLDIFGNVLAYIKSNKILWALFAVIIIVILIVLVNNSRQSSLSAYYIDDSDMLHYSSHCNSIDGSLELLSSEYVYEIAKRPNNVASPNYNFHFCGKCFDIQKIKSFKDSVSTHVFNTWGTTDTDSLSLLSKDIIWFLSESRLKYNWDNPSECLRYFKNPDNAIRYYTNECNNLNLGSPREFFTTLTPIFTSSISVSKLDALSNQKSVYDFLEYNNYEMESFKMYLEHIAQPVRCERLYNTLVSENAYDSFPLNSFEDFQAWLGL